MKEYFEVNKISEALEYVNEKDSNNIRVPTVRMFLMMDLVSQVLSTRIQESRQKKQEEQGDATDPKKAAMMAKMEGDQYETGNNKLHKSYNEWQHQMVDVIQSNTDKANDEISAVLAQMFGGHKEGQGEQEKMYEKTMAALQFASVMHQMTQGGKMTSEEIKRLCTEEQQIMLGSR